MKHLRIYAGNQPVYVSLGERDSQQSLSDLVKGIQNQGGVYIGNDGIFHVPFHAMRTIELIDGPIRAELEVDFREKV